jgi:hypothetical protein
MKTKENFIQEVITAIENRNKLMTVKLVYELARPKKDTTGIGLRESKEFVDDHFVPTRENVELLWKFAKGKLNNETN